MEYDPVYLLVERQHNDKVGFPAQAGFTKDDSILIKQAIGRLISHNEAVVDWRAVYGVFYGVEGTLLAQEEFNAIGASIAIVTVPLSAVAAAE